MLLAIKDIHPMDEYLELLSKYRKIYIDSARLDRAVSEAQYKADDLKALALLELRIESSGSYQMLTPDNIIDYLLNIGVDLDKRYRNKKTKSYSLDMKKVVDPLIADGVAVELLTTYKQYRTFRTYASFLSKLAEQKHIHCRTVDGRLILDYDTNIQERENLRVYYHDIAVVSIPKVFSNIVTGPSDEWHLAWCDYPQADWRFAYNLFIRDSSNLEQMKSCEDTYEGLARIVEGPKFNPEVFKSTRKDYKVDCLKTFYNSRDSKAIPTAMREYFMSRKKYRDYMYDLSILYHFKLPVPCVSYFGFEQMLPDAPYPDAFISKGLNTPIQTFTSHVVNETAFGILDKFRKLGYTEDDIRLYYVRHDELIFLFKDTILKDAWVFADCADIHIDGFTPIKLEFKYGNYYQEVDENLTFQIEQNIKQHPENITIYEEGEMHPYYPVPRVESLHVQFFKLEDSVGYKVVYYNYRNAERYRINSTTDDVTQSLYQTLNVLLPTLKSPKYLYVRSGGLDFMDAIGENEDTLLKVVDKYDSNVAVME